MSKLKAALIVLLLFTLGFFREFLFENINTHLYYLWKDESNPYLPSSLSFLEGVSYYPLYYAKFGLIVLFTLLFLAGSIGVVRCFFKEAIFTKITTWVFAGIFALSALIFGIGLMVGYGHEAYGISRKLIEFIQSPLACFFLVPSFVLYKRSTN